MSHAADPPDEPEDGAENDGDEKEALRPTSRERQEQNAELFTLAKRLVELEPARLAQLDIPSEVREAVLVGQGLGKTARTRQRRLIAQLLRVHEIWEMPGAKAPDPERQRRDALEQIYEGWRARLVSGGDDVLARFIDEHPMADPQELRQLLRAARRKPGSGKSKQALLEILDRIRRVYQTEASVRDATEDSS